MAVTIKNLIPAKQMEASQVTQYMAVNCKAIIDKFTVTNTSAANAVFSANLIASGGTAGNANLIVKTRSIAPNETYTCPELVGQTLDINGFISTLAGTASALTVMASGREVS
jgi:hypothetical protein